MSMEYIEKYRDGRHKCWKDLWIVRPIFVTLKLMAKTTVHRPITVLYPYEALWNPDNYRGRPGLDFNKCLGCGMCANYCRNDAFDMNTGSVDLNINGKDVDVPIICRQSDRLRANKLSLKLKKMIQNKEFKL